MLLLMTVFLCFNCSGQDTKAEKENLKKLEKNAVEAPKGSWKVDKEFDKNGNLIRYDSIYSWSSNKAFNNLSPLDKDSLIESFKLRFYSNFSGFENQGFEDIFSQDSLFSKRFFNDDFFGSDFGNDYMDIDKMRQQMLERQKQFLRKYQSEFIKPKDGH